MALTLVILFITGAMIGSFLNVCIWRLPRHESIVSPGSHCPGCDQPVSWYDNIPLISYAVLRGKCRGCGERISVRYPLVELLNAGLYVAAGVKFGITPALAPALVLIPSLIIIFFIDLEHYIIPNVVVLPVAVVGLGLQLAVSLTTSDVDYPQWWAFLVAGVAAAAFFFLVAFIFPAGMGMGDVKLAGMLGFFLGPAVTIGLFLGFLLGAVIGIGLMIAGKKGRKSKVPFGPFLAVGALVALFWGQQLLDYYLGFFQSG